MTLREQFIASAQKSCRHFTGIQNKKCAKWIAYEHPDTPALAMPCIPAHINNRPTWPCEFFEIMSLADAEKEADDRVIAFGRGARARRAAHDDAESKGFGKGSGGVSSIPCPCCGGTLHYSVAGYNGHMHGRCSTAGCVSWME